jgi:hypothetical protein
MLLAEFNDCTALRFILANARWAGGSSQAELRKEYFRERLLDGIRRLPHTADLLVEVLVEIIEELEGEATP